MKKTICLASLVLTVGIYGQEILQNSSFDSKYLWQDISLSQPAGHFEASKSTEDLTWNNCLKLELKKLNKGCVGAILLIGKDGKKTGFPAKPETTYEFSFEVKGTVPNAVSAALLFHNDDAWWKPGASKRVKTTLDSFRVTSEWTRFKGSFRTAGNTVRAALIIQLWANEKLAKKWKPGQYLLVDNLSVKERKLSLTAGTEARAEKAKPVPAFLTGTANTFGAGIPFEVRSEKGNAVVTVTLPDSKPKRKVAENGSQVWEDDVVEVFFSRNGIFRQFVLASGGGRYSGDGQKELRNYADWKGTVSNRKFVFEIPWKMLDFTPEPGNALLFNIGAQFGGKAHFLPPLTRNFHDVTRYNLLIVDSLREYLKKQFTGSEKLSYLPVPEAVGRMRAMKQAAALKKSGNAVFIAARFSPVHGFFLPLEITEENILDPDKTIELTALVNEHKVLPLAIMNRTEKTETYRIVVRNTNPKDEIDRNGLDGGFDGITLREALAVKDSDAAGADRIFDPLPKMNEAQTLTIEPGAVRLCWISFDCDRPGKFRGAIRIIPLGEPAVVKRNYYSGKMKDYPLVLNVLDYSLKPLRAQGLWGASGISENFFQAHQALAPGEILISPWSFAFRFDAQGNVINRLPGLTEKIRRWHVLYPKYHSNPKFKFALAYSVYDTMVRAFLPKTIRPHSPECMNAFRNYLRAMAALMHDAGVPESEYCIELVDEPHGKYFERHLQMAKAAREALPNGNFVMTWAPQNFGYTPEMIRKFIPYVDRHMFHHLLLRDEKYVPVIEEVKRIPGKYYGYYVCSTSMREDLHRYYRMVGWKGFQTGARFYHVYTLCESPWGNPGAVNWKLAAAGGLFLRAGDTAVPTIRSEALREGFTDIRYLELLNDPDFSRKAVREVMNSQHDTAVPEQIRRKVIQRLQNHRLSIRK